MRRFPLWFRALTLIFALLQGPGTAAAAVVDASLGSPGRATAVAHLEEPGSTGCPRSHPAECGICQYVSAALELPRAGAELPAPVLRAANPAAGPDGIVARDPHSLPLSRGPPPLHPAV